MQSAQTVTLNPTTEAFVEGLEAQVGRPLHFISEGCSPGPAGRASISTGYFAAGRHRRPDDPGGPTGNVSLRIVRPAGVAGRSCSDLYPWWRLGSGRQADPRSTDPRDRKRRQVAVVFVDYTRSPKPTIRLPSNRLTVMKWAAKRRPGRSRCVRLVVAGDSVGGNMTAAVTLFAKERGGPQIAYQMLFYPVTDANFDTPSYQQLPMDLAYAEGDDVVLGRIRTRCRCAQSRRHRR